MSHQPGPLVYIANHMRLLETLILPGIALAFNRVTNIIKEELRHYIKGEFDHRPLRAIGSKSWKRRNHL